MTIWLSVMIDASHTASALLVGVIAMTVSERTPRPAAPAIPASAAVHVDIGSDAATTIPDSPSAAAMVPARPGGLSRGLHFTKSTSKLTTVAPSGDRTMAP